MTDAAMATQASADGRLRSALTAFFRRRVPDPTEAEDLTQEALIRLIRARRHISSPDHYVFKIASNLLRDRARRLRVRTDYIEACRLEAGAGVDVLDPFRIAAGRQDLELLSRAIASLPEKTRTIFVLYRIENIEKAAIAQQLGLSVRMVEIHIRRALQLAYQQMEDAQ